MNLTDDTLSAFLDGELPEADMQTIRHQLVTDPALGERLLLRPRMRIRAGVGIVVGITRSVGVGVGRGLGALLRAPRIDDIRGLGVLGPRLLS